MISLYQVHPSQEVLEQLDENMSELDLSNLWLPPASLDVIFSSITCCMTLTCLDTSGTFLGDHGFTSVVKCLQALPSVTVLKFGCTGITAKSLKEVSGIVGSVKEEYKVIFCWGEGDKIVELCVLGALRL